MSEPDRLDLSPLDPARDPAGWQAVVDATLAGVDAALARRAQDPLSTIAGWRRPLLAAAAVLLSLLIPIELTLELRETRVERVERLVSLSAGVGRGDAPPSGSDFVRALAEEARP